MPQATPSGKICACSSCASGSKLQPLTAFGRNRTKVDGYETYCKVCKRAAGKAYRAGLAGTVPPDQRPTPPVYAAPSAPKPPPPPLPPLEQAFEAHDRSRAAKELKREHAALLDEVKRQRALLEALQPLKYASTGTIPPAPAPEKGEAVPLITFSDWHLEEQVDPEKMHGINEYNLAIAEQRAHSAFRNALRLVDLAARDSTVKRCLVGLQGDFFSGSIHPELMEVNQLGPQPAARFARDLLAAGIRYWLENSDLSFEFACVGGNHGRMTEKTRISTNAENSLETFMYYFLANEFEGEPRVKFRIATGDMLYTDVFPGFRVRHIHGDQISYQGGVGGLTIPLNKWIDRQNQSIAAQLTTFGHFHQRIDLGRGLGNGSLIGASPYSQRFGFSPEPPQQQFALLNWRGGHGTKSLVAPIWVTP